MLKLFIVLFTVFVHLSLTLALYEKYGNISLITNSYFINLISQLTKNSKNELNILIVDVPPYSMKNDNTEHLEGVDVFVIRTILTKLNINASFNHTKDLDLVSRDDLE